MKMKLVVGLGNPGKQYENTRHNAGFAVVELLAKQMQNADSKNQNDISKFKVDKKFEAEVFKSGEVLVAKPQTYMNDSGRAVSKLVNYYGVELEDVWVVHDDLDIEFGKFKIELGRGPKIHNGVNDVEEQLGSVDFWRVRVGVDSRSSEERAKIAGRDYVLMKLGEEEREKFDGVCSEIVDELRSKIVD